MYIRVRVALSVGVPETPSSRLSIIIENDFVD